MSDHRDSTTAPKSIGELSENIVDGLREKLDADDATRLANLMDLENDICCLRSMASIMDELLERFLVDHTTKSSRADRSNGVLQIKLGDYEMNMLCFVWKDVLSRAVRLEKAFFVADEGRAVQ